MTNHTVIQSQRVGSLLLSMTRCAATLVAARYQNQINSCIFTSTRESWLAAMKSSGSKKAPRSFPVDVSSCPTSIFPLSPLHCVSMSEWALTSPRVRWGQAHNVQSCHGYALNITLCCSQVIKAHRHAGLLQKQRALTLTDASLLNGVHWCMKRLMLSAQH